MPLNDLPPWLSGESDKGFLQGAQLGITAARTGTEIAQTRQQMGQEAELQPFRVAAADIANKLNRQSFDLGAALFPLKIQQAELANQSTATQIVGQATGNQVNMMKLGQMQGDAVKLAPWLANNDPAWKRDNVPSVESEWGLKAVQDHLAIAAKTSMGMTQANIQSGFWADVNAVSSFDRKLAVQAISALGQNGEITPAAEELIGDAMKKVRAAKSTEEIDSKLNLFKGQQDIMEKRQIELQKLKNEGTMAAVKARAEAVDLNKSGITRDELKRRHDIFNKEFALATKEAQLTGDYSRVHQIIDDAKSGKLFESRETAPESPRLNQIKEAISNAEKAKTAFQLQPEEKQTQKEKDKIVADLTRGKILLAKEEGRRMNWSEPWEEIAKRGFKQGDLVVVPADLDSTDPVERLGEHLITWPGDKEMKHRLDVKRIKGKQAQAQEKRDREAAWMEQNSGWQYSRPPAF